MIPQLFIVRENELQINVDYVREITEFNLILRRQTSMKGDMDGRKKKLNLLELLYVKLMADSRLQNGSIYAAMEDKEKSRKIAEDIGLPEEWKPSPEIKNAIRKYDQILTKYIPSVKILLELERALNASARSIGYTVEQIHELYDIVDDMKKSLKSDKELSRMEQLKNLGTINDTLNSINSTVTNLLKMSTAIPNNIATIREMRSIVLEEEQKANTIKGGKTKGNREDPR